MVRAYGVRPRHYRQPQLLPSENPSYAAGRHGPAALQGGFLRGASYCN